MPTLHITEYHGLANTGYDGQVPIPDESTKTADQVVTVPALAGPANSSNAFVSTPTLGPGPQANPPVVLHTRWVYLLSDTACTIAFGTAPAATANNALLPANVGRLFRVASGLSWKVSCLGVV